LAIVLYGYEARSLNLRDEYKLQISANGAQENEQELNYLYKSRGILIL